MMLLCFRLLSSYSILTPIFFDLSRAARPSKGSTGFIDFTGPGGLTFDRKGL